MLKLKWCHSIQCHLIFQRKKRDCVFLASIFRCANCVWVAHHSHRTAKCLINYLIGELLRPSVELWVLRIHNKFLVWMLILRLKSSTWSPAVSTCPRLWKVAGFCPVTAGHWGGPGELYWWPHYCGSVEPLDNSGMTLFSFWPIPLKFKAWLVIFWGGLIKSR